MNEEQNLNTAESQQLNIADVSGCSYRTECGREFNYLKKIEPPKSTKIFIHTKDDEVLEAFGAKTNFGWDFLLHETQIWIDENDVFGWSFPQ